MILKNLLVLIILLWGSLVVTAYSEYDDEGSNIQAQNTQVSAADIALSNEQIYNPVQFQQEIESNERMTDRLINMDTDMDIDYKTEIPEKNVRNISENQLSNEYASLEYEDEHKVGVTEAEMEYENNKNKQSTEQNSMIMNKDQEYETENPLSKNLRMGRLFTSTTTVPQYINKLHEHKPIVLAKDLNVSNSDYVEEDDETLVLKNHKTTIPLNKHLDNSSEENDEIVPLAMKYYDDIPPENASSARHIEEISSEDYYEEKYHDQDLTKKTTSTTTLPTPNNILRSLFGGLTTTTTASFVTKAPTTPTPTPPTTTLTDNNPAIGLFTTLAPLPAPPQSQTQIITGISASHITNAAAAAVAASSAAVPNDKRDVASYHTNNYAITLKMPIYACPSLSLLIHQ